MDLIFQIRSSPLWAAVAFCAFYGAMWTLSAVLQALPAVRANTTAANQRYGALDGLRGVLAYGVMTHHTITAYVFFKTGSWSYSDNPVLNQLGQSTVALFFMITGFLFAKKCFGGKIAWGAMYANRVARLFPLYILVIALVFLSVFWLSGFALRVPGVAIALQAVQWVMFGRPDINGFPMTWTLISGVNWSLRYEWLFYLAGVPLIHVFATRLGQRVSLWASLVCLGAISLVAALRGEVHGTPLYLAHFVCGVLASLVHGDLRGGKVISSPAFRLVGMLSILGIAAHTTSGNAMVLACSLLFFLAVVGGFSFWGLLSTRAAVWLGDVSYGVYLIHGLVIWWTFHVFRSAGGLDALDSGRFAGLLFVLGAAVLVLASLAYLWVEKPAMKWNRGRHSGRLPKQYRGGVAQSGYGVVRSD